MGDLLLSLIRIRRETVINARMALSLCSAKENSARETMVDARMSIERESQIALGFPVGVLNAAGFAAWLKNKTALVESCGLQLSIAITDTDNARADTFLIKATEKAIVNLKQQKDDNRRAVILKRSQNELSEILYERSFNTGAR